MLKFYILLFYFNIIIFGSICMASTPRKEEQNLSIKQPVNVEKIPSIDLDKYPEVSQEEFNKIKYSINFVWVNRNKNVQDKYIFPTKYLFSYLQENRQSIFDRIKKWSSINKEAEVILWYDSELVTQAQVQATVKEFKGSSVKLKDLRKLKIVQELFSNLEVNSLLYDKEEGFNDLPVYFRADWFRTVAAQSSSKYFVYSDLDVFPQNKKEIFSNDTVYKLKNFGLVMGYIPHSSLKGIENAYFILSPFDPEMRRAHKKIIIEQNFNRAVHALKETMFPKDNRIDLFKESFPYQGLNEIVYHSYLHLYPIYYNMKGWVKITHPEGMNFDSYSFKVYPKMMVPGKYEIETDIITTGPHPLNNRIEYKRRGKTKTIFLPINYPLKKGVKTPKSDQQYD